jgi:hypothetical protein
MAVSGLDALDVLLALRNETSSSSPDERAAFLNFCLRHAAESSSQYFQDLWVAYELGSLRGGFFVEFGAADGRRISNTYYLEKTLGWTGILAEPARVWYPALRNNRKGPIDERCVWKETGHKVVFNEAPVSLHSTIHAYSDGDGLADTRKGGVHYEVGTVSLMDLLQFWNAPRHIHYMSIDTEGSELDILEAFDFSAYDIALMTIEQTRARREQIQALMASRGYVAKFPNFSRYDGWYVKTYD